MRITSRRTLLKLLAGLPLALVACGGDSEPIPPTQTPVPPSPEPTLAPVPTPPPGLDLLDPQIRQELTTIYGPTFPRTEDEIVLLEFLVTAANASASGRSRVQYFESDSPAVKTGSLAVERQLASLKLGRIAFVTFDGRSHVVFVTSDDESFTLQTPFARQVVDWVRQFLPEIDRLLGGADWVKWLHLQLRTRGSISYAQGCNVYIRAGAEAPAENVVHLLALTYIAPGMPPFIFGGFADVIAEYLTGRATRASFVTGEKVHLAFRAAATSVEYNREAANGYAFFKSLLSIAGPEAFFGALSLMVEHELSFGIGVLRLLKSKIDDKEAVEALYIERIADYVPGSA